MASSSSLMSELLSILNDRNTDADLKTTMYKRFVTQHFRPGLVLVVYQSDGWRRHTILTGVTFTTPQNSDIPDVVIETTTSIFGLLRSPMSTYAGKDIRQKDIQIFPDVELQQHLY